MKLGDIVEGFTPPPHPKGIVLEGKTVCLEPLNADRHGPDLFASNGLDQDGVNWAYLPYGPYADLDAYKAWLASQADLQDPCFFAIVRKSDGIAVGVAAYLRITPQSGSIEVGHIHYSPRLQRTREGTEAMFLMMKWAFDAGYRRYEWKCNALNAKSRNAAQRLGFSYEGVFRQMTISKGRNRNTAWFAMIDKEWDALKACFETYLSADNYDEEGHPKQSLAFMTKPLLYKLDNHEFLT